MNRKACHASFASVRFAIAIVMLVVLVSMAAAAQASVVINGTRVVYPAGEREVVVRLDNRNERPALVQAWLDNGDEEAAPESIRVPFTMTPPIFRIDPGKQQALRLGYTGEPLPLDKESLFWMNTLEVPPKADADERNMLQFAFRTRIKIFFRPKGLPYPVTEAPGKLEWQLRRNGQGYALDVRNPTPYHVSFNAVVLVAGDSHHAAPPPTNGTDGMVAPGAALSLALPDLRATPVATAKVRFEVIDDYGAREFYEAKIAP